jgi:hypothetical protein
VESSWLYYIFFCGFHRELVQLLLLDSTRITCTPQRARGARWCVSEATSCRLRRDRYNLQGVDFGASQVVSELRFCRYPRVQSAYRTTFSTDVVESSVKTILLKMHWIVLNRSVFFSLPLCFSPLTFVSFESSFLSTSLSFRFTRGWTNSCLYPNRSILLKFIIVIVSNHPLLVVSRRNLLLVVSRRSTRRMKNR